MKNSRKHLGLLLAAAATLGLLPAFARAAEPVFTGKLFEQIDATNPLSAIVIPSIGLSASPKPQGNEIGDAFGEFADPRAAMSQLENLKRKNGFSGGRVFVGFTYDSDHNHAKLYYVCGISPSESRDFDEILAHHADQLGWDSSALEIGFGQFKLASRAERVRSIARCLSSLPGMPKLRPTHPDVRKIYIDEASYRLAEKWLRSLDPVAVQGDSAQYRKAFVCLVSAAARAMPEAVGESVVLRSTSETAVAHRPPPAWQHEVLHKWLQVDSVEEEYQLHSTYLSVLNDSAARKIWSRTDGDGIDGLWPTRLGIEGTTVKGKALDPIEMVLGEDVPKWLPDCRRSTGLFELPPARVPEPASSPRCQN